MVRIFQPQCLQGRECNVCLSLLFVLILYDLVQKISIQLFYTSISYLKIMVRLIEMLYDSNCAIFNHINTIFKRKLLKKLVVRPLCKSSLISLKQTTANGFGHNSGNNRHSN